MRKGCCTHTYSIVIYLYNSSFPSPSPSSVWGGKIIDRLQSCLSMCLGDIQNLPSELRSFGISSLIKTNQPIVTAQEQTYKDLAESHGLFTFSTHPDWCSCPDRAQEAMRYHPGARVCRTLMPVLGGSSEHTWGRCAQVEELLRLVTFWEEVSRLRSVIECQREINYGNLALPCLGQAQQAGRTHDTKASVSPLCLAKHRHSGDKGQC